MSADDRAVSPVRRWERRSEVPLILPAAAFLLAYAWPVLDPRLDPDLRTLLTTAAVATWILGRVAEEGRRAGPSVAGRR